MAGPRSEATLIDAEEDLVAAPPVAAARRRLRAHPALIMAGIVLAAVNMRAALAGVSPLLGEIGRHFRLTATASSLVTTIPLIFMGLGSIVAPKLARRWGTEAALCGALVALCGGIVLRIAPPVVALFAGCAVVGTSIALLNVLMPGLIKRDFPERAAGMTALYSTAMILGATVSAASAVPLESALGTWQGALVSWSLPAAVAAVVWVPQTLMARRGTRHGAAAATPLHVGEDGPKLSRSSLAWQVTLFMGSQSLIAYVSIAWMPTIFTDHGMGKGEAGLVFAFSTLLQMVGSFIVPMLAGRMRRQRLLAVAVSALMACGIGGLLLAPVAGAWLWAAFLGVGQGGALGLALTMMVLRSGDAHTAARLSGMAQTGGYLLAAAGPLVLGAVHQATHGWTVPLVLLIGVCAGLALVGMGAGRDQRIGAPAVR
ncbi:MFS transporter, CP family, cyanate transporter [Streptomyces sp. 2224.1]|uniref:CynX/NimT family MFS transporter n=1 Tax=unclassified Streptomyces TaxID=2593676 RepID=UPI000883674D|nr:MULTISPECIES: MFS transporter [unclassified Streptomyces]PBC83767.1 CP family cyanate transporter-like MFS transporter [Streptomyces sp. 2321.6]SDR38968.1 MFS transporter, CP family, cyanate transporter [Streptomyces sp. KS_16]SEB94617.1 MFS transporter, CP family, cyanate transporter [Streptomyces sp. 2224.1]SED07322.1 MFS transporter, CP family, cyanate transporter [Streptomyces sp. 2133.1]SNC69846.1 MFS transporter, CP family, cyanate transporter [Streptomyces sp. 2114.4]